MPDPIEETIQGCLLGYLYTALNRQLGAVPAAAEVLDLFPGYAPAVMNATASIVEALQELDAAIAGLSAVDPAAPVFTGTLARTGIVSPVPWAANIDDYNPGAVSIVRAEPSGASRNLTGMVSGIAGRVVTLFNISTSQNLVLKNADSGSSAPNQFLFGADLTLGPSTGVSLWYDTTTQRWRKAHP